MQNQTQPFTWRCGLLLGCIALFIAAALRHARAEDCLAQVDETALQRVIAKLSPGYDDVAACLACGAQKHPMLQALCRHPRLRLMEVLNKRAAVYAYENATKRETNHANPDCSFVEEQLAKVADVEAACRLLKSNTDESLGGMSPYAARGK